MGFEERSVITKCPHCNTKFKVSDDYKGRKTKCPKCKQLFTISEFIDKPAPSTGETKSAKRKLEVCTSCGGTIGRLEKTCVFNGEIVCAECDKKLRKPLTNVTRLSRPAVKNLEQVQPPVAVSKVQKIEVEYKGVGGWLLLFCLILTVISPLFSVISFFIDFSSSSQYFGQYPRLKTIIAIDGVLFAGVMAFGIYSGILLWTISPNAVKIARTYLIVYLGIIILEVFRPLLLELPPDLSHDMVVTGLRAAGYRYAFFVSVWYSYLNKSKRVKATYPEFQDKAQS